MIILINLSLVFIHYLSVLLLHINVMILPELKLCPSMQTPQAGIKAGNPFKKGYSGRKGDLLFGKWEIVLRS